ncbi:MAG: tetratricopeptide repeat protein [Myxococcales bacterium]|nr:tetratricopeptide repeat protein [Myxococcales bacterium]
MDQDALRPTSRGDAPRRALDVPTLEQPRARSADAAPLGRGRSVGRYLILRTLGVGGMGMVFLADDPELDRKVALKLLHPSRTGDPDATRRLLREAQALAQLSHPNLVPVFEVGRFEGQVFIAMELVRGVTLHQWVHRTPRPWREVLTRWLEVTRALQAVHEAGLVHRDVKPTNVIVGEDGRARLVDFGLVRGQQEVSSTSTETREEPEGISASSSALTDAVTQSRAMVGTPAYMAPEARWGQAAGPRTDQYSLCVGLYESLFGRRPPLVTDGSALELPDDVTVPPALRALLTRGLAFDPHARWPSMRALGHEMERILGQRKPRWARVAGGLALAAGLGGAATWALVEPTPAAVATVEPCVEVHDDLAGVWDPARRRALQRAIESTALPYGPSLATTLDERLDGYARGWLQARYTACAATHVEQVQSPALLDRRMACLDEQRRRLASVLEAGARVDAAQAPRLSGLVASLEDPSECLSEAWVTSSVPPPPLEQREAVAALRTTLAALRVRAVLEGTAAVLQPAQQALAEAERLRHEPLLAEATLAMGHVYRMAEDARARPMLERSADLAEAVDHVGVKEEALHQLVRVATDLELDLDRARRALARDLATLTRLGEPPRRMAAAMELRSAIAAMESDYDTAEQSLRLAIERWAELGEHTAPQQANAWRNLGNLLSGRDRPLEAQQAFARAQELTGAWDDAALALAPHGTRPGQAALMQGLAEIRASRLDSAQAWLERAQREGTLAYGDDSVFIGRVHGVWADLALRRGDLDAVMEHARASDERMRRWLGEDTVLRVAGLSAIGTVAFHRGHADEAVEAFAEALRLQRRSLPADGLDVATARSNLGEALVLAGRYDEARPALEQALAAMERRLSASHPQLALPLDGLARIALERDELDSAQRHAQRALDIREAHADHPVELARTRWLLARVERRRGAPERARTLAQRARETFGQLGPDFAAEVEHIDAWLDDP